MKSAVAKRSLLVGGHRTSVSLEDAFWMGLREIANNRGMTLSDLVGEIDMQREHANLSSALRLFVFDHFCHHAGEAGSHGAGAVNVALPATPKR